MSRASEILLSKDHGSIFAFMNTQHSQEPGQSTRLNLTRGWAFRLAWEAHG